VVGDDKAQDSVTEQLEALVGRPATPLRAVGTVGKRLMEQFVADAKL
jgi:hypothetical protein